MNKFACVVLAAGKSSRFGSPKMHFCLDGKQAMLSQTLSLYLDFFDMISVVVSADDSVSEKILAPYVAQYNIKVMRVNDNDLGLSHSLRCGIESQKDADGWLVVLGDMPLVRKDTISELFSHFDKSKIVAPYLKADQPPLRQGNPVFIGADFRIKLTDIDGDVGAKTVLQNNPSAVVKLITDDIGVVTDFDVKP